jgi:hypothetical protein
MGPVFRRDDGDDLHHRLADVFTSAIEGYAGEQAISAFSESTQALPFEKPALWRVATPCQGTSTVRDIKGGIRTRFTRCEVSEIFTTSVR